HRTMPRVAAPMAILFLAGAAGAQSTGPAGAQTKAPALTQAVPPPAAPERSTAERVARFRAQVDSRQRRVVPLREALRIAAQKGPDVAAARAQAAVVGVSVERAYTAWKPDISASGTFDHTSAPQVFDASQLRAALGLGPPAAGTPRPPVIEIVGANTRLGNIQLSQPLFTPQGIFLPGIAKDAAIAADKGADEAREQVLLSVARSYLGLQGVEGLLDAARDAERVALRREEDAKARIAAGTDVEIALLRAQTDTAQARVQIAVLEGQRAGFLPLLEALTGEPIAPEPLAASSSLAQGAAEESAQPWENAYAVQSAIAQARVEQGSVKYDKFLWLPSVAGVARGNYNSNAGFAGTNTSYDLILNVTIPLYDRGTRYAHLHEDEARLRQAVANLAATRARARAAWEAVRANLISSEVTLDQAEAQARLAARAQEQVEASYKAGVATSLDLTDADNKKFAAASAAAQARATVEVRRAEIAAAEGRLFEDLAR
ncbi:MAG: TolC family protein, partial [Myxococcales bacterium]